MAASDARPLPRKNVAYRVTFPIFDADGDLVTGAASLDSEVSKDAGTFADCTSEATEIATASGMYYLDLTADEMNADTVAIIVKTATVGAKTTPIVLYPEEAGDVRCDVVQLGGVTQSLADLKDFADDGYDPSTNKIQGLVLADSLTALANNSITAAALAADAGAEIADAVWDEALAGHVGAGSAGVALTAAGSAGDPWATAVPGAYGAGTAGKILGDNVNATISSRASQTSLDTVDDLLDTEIPALTTSAAAIKAKTDNLPSDPADASDVAASFSSVASTLSTIAAYLDTEIAAIKAKTDNLPASPANETTLSTVAGYLDTEVAAIKAKTDNLPSAPAATGDAMALTSGERTTLSDVVLARALAAESYAADQAVPTLSQALYMLISMVGEFSISGTTLTCKKLDGSTTSMTFGLNSATAPTSRTRAT